MKRELLPLNRAFTRLSGYGPHEVVGADNGCVYGEAVYKRREKALRIFFAEAMGSYEGTSGTAASPHAVLVFTPSQTAPCSSLNYPIYPSVGYYAAKPLRGIEDRLAEVQSQGDQLAEVLKGQGIGLRQMNDEELMQQYQAYFSLDWDEEGPLDHFSGQITPMPNGLMVGENLVRILSLSGQEATR